MKRDWLWLGIGSFILYASLLTQQYVGDGLRWVSTITGPWPPALGGTNHLLFPVVGWFWYHVIGIRLPDTMQLQSIQLLNATAGAVGIALFASIIARLGANRLAIWLASLSLMFANAYWVNSTEMLEVMPSIPLIFLGIWLVVPGETDDAPVRLWRIVLAGVSLGMATAIYQASAFSVAALCASLWWRPNGIATRFRRLSGIVVTMGSFAITAAALYLLSLRFLGGAETWWDAFRMSLVTESPVAFGRVDPRHLVGSTFGWVAAWLGLFDYQGLSYLLRFGVTLNVLVNLSLVALQYGLCGITAWAAWGTKGFRSGREWRSLKILAVWFLPPFLFTAYWLPSYSKLWISPLAATVAAFALLLTASQSARLRWPAIAKIAALGLCGLTIAVNLVTGLLPSHFARNVYLEEALQISESIAANDLVITDWGASATYYSTFSKKPALSYAAVALEHTYDDDAVVKVLAQRIAETQCRGGTAFFLGILDWTPDDWRPLFGERFGLSYAQLDPYRAVATPVATISEKTLGGQPQHLWRLPPTDNACEGTR